jgi:hypothetical protein
MGENSRFLTGAVSANQGTTVVAGNKNTTINFATGNNFLVNLRQNTTIAASNLPGTDRATTATIVTQQPVIGFYAITWSNDYLWPSAQLGVRGGPNSTLANAAVDIFTVVSTPDIAQGEKLLGVAVANFY